MTRFSPFVPARFPREILALTARQDNVDLELLERAQALCEPQVEAPEDHVSLERLSQVCQAALQSCDDPWLGLKVGQSFSLARFGALGAAASSCQRAIDMLALLDSFSDSLLPVSSTMHSKGDRVTIEYALPPIFAREPEFHAQLIVATSCRLLEESVGYLPPSLAVALPFPRTQDYAAKFLCDVRYDQPALSITYPLSYLKSPLLSSDPAARKLFLEACENLAGRLRSSHTLGGSIRLMLANCQHRYPSLEQIADRLHVTSRTLRNRLARENLSYRELVKQQRVTQAKKMLEASRLSTAEISELLGYGNVASFSRAFKRETGLAPSTYRARDKDSPPTPALG
ncbi:MAG: AraC family transcriptional regulator ligand-binding domain-containing protein [Pseudomonadota bacterium]